jgi:predicted ABC-type ATPase
LTHRRPELVVIAGPNGSGKTTITTKVVTEWTDWIDGSAYINPDNIARDLFGDWNSPDAVIKAAHHAESERERLLREQKGMVFETVLSAPDKVDFLLRAKEAGYFVRLFFVSTDHPAINAARVTRRVMEGGHAVPIPKIISRYSKSIANCIAVASFADRAYIYDNSVDGKEAQLMFRTTGGQIAKTYGPIREWAQVIADTLSESPAVENTPAPAPPTL